MRTVILLTILAVLPISCKFYLFRDFAADSDEAIQAAQKLSDNIMNAAEIEDWDLFLSNYDKNFTAKGCKGGILTYDQMEFILKFDTGKESKNEPKEKLYRLKVVKAVFEGEYLIFETIKVGSSDSVSEKSTAIRRGDAYKLFKSFKENCPPPKRYIF